MKVYLIRELEDDDFDYRIFKAEQDAAHYAVDIKRAIRSGKLEGTVMRIDNVVIVYKGVLTNKENLMMHRTERKGDEGNNDAVTGA